MFISKARYLPPGADRCSAEVQGTTKQARIRMDEDVKCHNFAGFIVNGLPYCGRHAESMALEYLLKLTKNQLSTEPVSISGKKFEPCLNIPKQGE